MHIIAALVFLAFLNFHQASICFTMRPVFFPIIFILDKYFLELFYFIIVISSISMS